MLAFIRVEFDNKEGKVRVVDFKLLAVALPHRVQEVITDRVSGEHHAVFLFFICEVSGASEGDFHEDAGDLRAFREAEVQMEAGENFQFDFAYGFPEHFADVFVTVGIKQSFGFEHVSAFAASVYFEENF